jgi:hypothetical protein
MRALGNVPGAGASRSGFVTGGRRTLTTWLGTVRPVTGGLGRVLHKTSPTWQSRCARSRSLLRETARTAGSRLTTSGADSTYDSPDDFVAGVPPSEIAKIKGVMIGYTDGDPVVTVQILRSPLPRRYSPFIRASGKERAAVEGVARLVTNLFLVGDLFVRTFVARGKFHCSSVFVPDSDAGRDCSHRGNHSGCHNRRDQLALVGHEHPGADYHVNDDRLLVPQEPKTASRPGRITPSHVRAVSSDHTSTYATRLYASMTVWM